MSEIGAPFFLLSLKSIMLTSYQLKMPLQTPHIQFITQYCKTHNLRVDLAYSRQRKTKLGDHYWNSKSKTSQITVNEDDNHYRLFFVALHEMAHAYAAQKIPQKTLVSFFNPRSSIKPHGKEWKTAFRNLLHKAINQNLFPTELHPALLNHADSPKANVHSDLILFEALHKFDTETNNERIIYLKELADGDQFRLSDSLKKYTRIKLRRKRYLCHDENQRSYAISAMAEVRKV